MKNLPINELIERLRFKQWLEETRLQDTSDGKMWRAWKAAKTWLPDDDRAFISSSVLPAIRASIHSSIS